MGTFAETENVNYHFSFANKENHFPFFLFHMQKTNGSLLFLLSLCRKQMEVAIFN